MLPGFPAMLGADADVVVGAGVVSWSGGGRRRRVQRTQDTQRRSLVVRHTATTDAVLRLSCWEVWCADR